MLESEKLFLDIDGPRYMALRYIYAPEYIENGFRVGLGMNKYAANCMTIEKLNDRYIVKFFKNGRPKYNRNTGLFDPPTRKMLHKEELIDFLQLTQYLFKILEERYTF